VNVSRSPAAGSLQSIYSEVAFKEEELYKLSKLRENSPSASPENPGVIQRTVSVKQRRHTINSAESLPAVQNHLSIRDWQILLTNSEMLTFSPGQALFEEGGPCNTMYKIEEGIANISIKNQKLAEATPGDTLAEVYFLNSGERSWCSVVAETNITVTSLDKEFIMRIFEQELELSARFYKHLAIRLNNALRQSMAVFAREKSLSRRLSVINMDDPMEDSDRLFASIFKFKTPEVLLKVYAGKLGMLNGTVYVTKNCLCFYAKTFAFTSKKVIPFLTVEKIRVVKGNIMEFKLINKSTSFKLEFKQGIQDCETILMSLWEAALQPHSTYKPPSPHKRTITQDLNAILSKDDWELITKGKSVSYPAGTKFISEGIRPLSLFHIVKGVCLVQKNVAGCPFTVSRRHTGEIFGEMSFLDDSYVASASVVAETDVELHVLDYNFMHILLSVYKEIAPKFYKYLAVLLEKIFLEFLSQFRSKFSKDKEKRKEKNMETPKSPREYSPVSPRSEKDSYSKTPRTEKELTPKTPRRTLL